MRGGAESSAMCSGGCGDEWTTEPSPARRGNLTRKAAEWRGTPCGCCTPLEQCDRRAGSVEAGNAGNIIKSRSERWR